MICDLRFTIWLKCASLALLLSTINSELSTAFAQGSLTPPGAPAPTRLLTSAWAPARGVDDNDCQVPFAFTGKIDKLAFKVGPSQMVAADQKAAADADGKVND